MKKTSYRLSINRGRMTTTQGTHASIMRVLSFLLFLSWWRALKRRLNHPETVWISLEARHSNSSRTPLRKPYKYVFSFILDDEIICSRWLGVLNIWFNVFYCIWCFNQNFESLSTSESNSWRIGFPLPWPKITSHLIPWVNLLKYRGQIITSWSHNHLCKLHIVSNKWRFRYPVAKDS